MKTIFNRFLKFVISVLRVIGIAIVIIIAVTIVGPFAFVGAILFYLVQMFHEKLDWKTCKYCNEKQKMFFYTYETHIHETDDYIKDTQQICTSCAMPYFDNGGWKPKEKKVVKNPKKSLRSILIDYHMNTLYDQKSEENKVFVEGVVGEYLKNRRKTNDVNLKS